MSDIDFISTVLGLLLWGGGIGLYLHLKEGKKATISNLEYSEKDYQLILRKRDSSNHKVLKVERIWNATLGYEPEKHIYTGVTVGGVHTGGVDKIDAHYTVSGSSTNYFQVYYDNGDKYDNNRTSGGVEKVKLSDPELIDAAKKHPFVSKFLNGNTLVLGYKTLGKEDCKIILSWLCGESC